MVYFCVPCGTSTDLNTRGVCEVCLSNAVCPVTVPIPQAPLATEHVTPHLAEFRQELQSTRI